MTRQDINQIVAAAIERTIGCDTPFFCVRNTAEKDEEQTAAIDTIVQKAVNEAIELREKPMDAYQIQEMIVKAAGKV